MIRGESRIRKFLAGLVRKHDKADGLNSERAVNLLIAERAAMTGGRGFRQFPRGPKVRTNGKTRGEMKREARARANARIVAERKALFA